jgi:RluA family pseudouridine synthase
MYGSAAIYQKPMQELIVPAGDESKNLQSFLKKRFPIGYIRKLFRKHGIRLNGQRPKPDDATASGDRIQLYIPFDERTGKPSRSLGGIATIEEDDALLVIDKPAGIAVHEGKTVARGESLAGYIENKYRHQKIRPKLAHRLDKDTSGLVLLAKNDKALNEIESQFADGKVGKEYVCLVVGRVPTNEGIIEVPLPGRDGSRVRAVTRYRVLKRFATTTLLQVSIETGRLHQIRLHFAKLGYPVVLDDQHGDFAFNKRFRKEFALKRQFLHATKLTLNFAGKRRTWISPLPDDLQKTLARLETGTK